MRKRLIFRVALLLFGVTPFINSQGITGSATIGADPNTDVVSASCETDTDADTLGVYKAVVHCSVVDSNGNSRAHGAATDTTGFNGYAQVNLTFTGVPGTTYTVIGTYLATPIIRQRLMYFDSQPYYNYYDDLYYLEGFMIDGSATYQDVPSYYWYGPGPETPTTATPINLGSTTESVTIPQNPGALAAISSPAITYKTPYQNGCPVTSPYGASIMIKYQVLDDTAQHLAIANSSMEPQEQTSNFIINGTPTGSGAAPSWKDIGPSTYSDGTPVPGTAKYTSAQGAFMDAPFQLCANGAFTSATITQAIRIMLPNSATPNVRTNNWAVTSSSIGHGTITNGVDVNHTF